jgi:hypothetical protein
LSNTAVQSSSTKFGIGFVEQTRSQLDTGRVDDAAGATGLENGLTPELIAEDEEAVGDGLLPPTAVAVADAVTNASRELDAAARFGAELTVSFSILCSGASRSGVPCRSFGRP